MVQKKEEEVEKQVNFSLFPNPASAYIIIQLDNTVEGEVEIQLSDIYGKIVQKEKKSIDGESTFIETYTLTEGMYFCAISINGNRIGTKKFMLIK